jgi:lipooligosaccharide transport system permease protein
MIATKVSYRSVKVWQRNRDVFGHLWKAEMIWPLLEPMVVMLGLGLGLGRFVALDSGQDYIQFITPGLMAAFPMWATIFESGWGAYTRMETQKTYDAMIATPVSIDDVIAGEVLWASTKGMISAVYILLFALVLTPFYDLVQSPLVVLVLPVAFLSGLMLGSMALLATAFVRSISQLSYFVTLVIMPMFWSAGVFFPLDEVSHSFRLASWFMPLTHVVNLERALVSGDLGARNLVDVAWMLVVTALVFQAVLIAMRRRLVK